MTADDVTLSSSPGARIARNAIYLLVSDVAVRVVTAAVAILVARYLGPEQYGVLSVALALLGIAGYFSELGVNSVMIREGTKPSVHLPRLLSGTLHLRLVLAAVTSLFVVLVAWFFYPMATMRLVILSVVLPGVWAGVFRGIGVGYFQMVQEMQYVALINAVAAVAGAGVFLLAVLGRWSLPVLSLGYGFSAAVGGALGFALLRRRVSLQGRWYPDLLLGLPAFAISGGLGLLVPQLGPLLLPSVAGLEETGFFAAAHRIYVMLLAVPGVFAAAFFPQLFVYGNTDAKKHQELLGREIRLVGTLGILMAIPITFYAGGIARAVLGSAWAERSGGALTLLGVALALSCLSWPLADALTTRGLQARRAGVQGLAVVLGAGAYWLLGKAWGARGAALAALVVEIVLLAGFLLALPLAAVLLRSAILPVALKAFLLSGIAWLVRSVVKLDWVGLGFTIVFTSAVAVLGDGEILAYLTHAWKKSFLHRVLRRDPRRTAG